MMTRAVVLWYTIKWTLKNRFKTYNNERFPILDYYKNQNLLYEIDGMRDISAIYKEISPIIRSLEAWLYNIHLYK